MDEKEVTGLVIGAAIEVHRILGPGLLESVYQKCLMKELCDKGVFFESEVCISAEYKGEVFEDAYRLDLIVDNNVIVELKAVDKLADKHTAQLLTYLRLTKKKLGLLINFNEVVLKNGIKRVVNKL